MDVLGFIGAGLLFVIWAATTTFLVRDRPEDLRTPGSMARTATTVTVCLLAGVAGCWGPTVHRVTETSLGEEVSAQTAESIRVAYRTLLIAGSRTVDVTPGGEVIRETRTRAYHVPVALLALLAWAGWRARNGGRAGRVRTAAAVVAVLAIATGAGLVGCERDRAADRPDRVVFEGGWDTLVFVESLPEDTVFFSITRLAADSFGMRVLDGAGNRIAMVDWQGRVRWYAGRRGSGPGEFQNPRALSVAEDGSTWVLDVGNHRITGYDRTGRLVGEVSLGALEFVPHEFAVSRTGDRFFLAYTERGIRPIVVTREGDVREGRRVRVPGASRASGLALQGDIRPGPGAEEWVFALSMADGFVRFDGLEPRTGLAPYVEHVPLPEVEETVEGGSGSGTVSRTRRIASATFASRGASVADDRLLIPFGGATPLRDRLLDVYGWGDGGYRGSLVLPDPGLVAAWNDRLALAGNVPHPHIAVLRPERWP